MAQGEFTLEETLETEKAVNEIMTGMPRKASLEFIGHFNDILLFLNAVKEHFKGKK